MADLLSSLCQHCVTGKSWLWHGWWLTACNNIGGSGGKFVDGCIEVHRGYYEVEMVVQA